jgi:phosphoenolpyruvate carboxylase
LLLGAVRERLIHAAEEARDAKVLAGETPAGAGLERGTIAETLAEIEKSLKAGRGVMLAGGELQRMQEQLEIFGLHTARLDLRQHSSQHAAAVAEALGVEDYPSLAEARKREV